VRVLAAILRRERRVLAAGLAVLVALAWLYIWRGAGMGMSALDMTRAVIFPHRQDDVPGQLDLTLPLIMLMWWTMMIAMMTPSAAPLILLYTRVAHHHRTADERAAGTAIVPATFLAAGYLLIWLLFSLAAAAVQQALQPAGLLSGMMLWSRSALLSASVLAAAGLYQLTPLKQACLAHCRAPAQFLVRHWRPGRIGALVLGMRHGAYCVGCCWLLMALLFVGGVMNLIWIAALAVFVLVEKLSPPSAAVDKWCGALLIIWALATLWVR
jgi:predicted metal-binding membrane protein